MTERLIAMTFVVILGALSRRWHRVDPTTLTRITLEIFMPFLIFLSIIDSTIDTQVLVHPAAACAAVILGTLGAVKLASLAAKKDLMRFSIPIAFMNSGFLAFPVVESLGGAEWLSVAIIYDQMMNLIIFTVGLSILQAGDSFTERMKQFALNPVLISIFCAAAFKISGALLPGTVRTLFELPSRATIPLALFSVGAGLADLRISRMDRIGIAVAGRYLLGAGIAFAYCRIAGVTGAIASVIMISSTMPSAVLSFLLPARYGKEADYAAGVVIVSTILYPLVLPLVLKLA